MREPLSAGSPKIGHSGGVRFRKGDPDVLAQLFALAAVLFLILMVLAIFSVFAHGAWPAFLVGAVVCGVVAWLMNSRGPRTLV